MMLVKEPLLLEFAIIISIMEIKISLEKVAPPLLTNSFMVAPNNNNTNVMP